MKKGLTLLLASLLVCGLCVGCGDSKDQQQATTTDTNATTGNVVKLGIYEPASGDNGAGGKQETLGYYYAQSVQPTVKVGDTEYQVELIAVDNESSNDKAATAASTLVSAGISAAMGSYGSGVSIAGSDIFGNAGIPIVGTTCTNPQVTSGNTHYFRICFLDPFQGTVLANFAKDVLNADTVYCLAKLGDDYSAGLCKYFQEAFEGLGGTVISETFPEGNSDFNSYLNNAKNAGATVFFAPVSTEAVALIIDQAYAQGTDMTLLGSDTWDSNVILNAATGKDIDIYITTFYQEGGDSPAAQSFDKGVKEWINADPQRLADNGGNDIVAAPTAMAYDNYMFILEAIKNAGSIEPAAIMEALWTTEYDGVSGHIALDDVNGDAIRDTAFIKKVNTETGLWDFQAVQGVK
jgi:branched-chain amino acid transport system substrate-binding protein